MFGFVDLDLLLKVAAQLALIHQVLMWLMKKREWETEIIRKLENKVQAQADEISNLKEQVAFLMGHMLKVLYHFSSKKVLDHLSWSIYIIV